MCGRYYNRSEKQEIARRLKAGKVFTEPYPANFNIAPSTFQPIVRAEREPETDATQRRELILARWGLVPFFAKTVNEFKTLATFNARAEGILKSQTWSGPMKTRRCLVPADGFYEWKALSDSPKAKKQPYAITLSSGEPFAFAGLWDAWKEPKPAKTSVQAPDTWLQSFTIITTEANELMSQIHTRMPVILRERDWNRWLDRDFGSQPEELHELTTFLRPFDSDAMSLAPCNPAVGNVKNNGEELLTCPASDAPLGQLNSA